MTVEERNRLINRINELLAMLSVEEQTVYVELFERMIADEAMRNCGCVKAD